jgi:hypothetical protein
MRKPKFWHLAVASTLQEQLPELLFLTFDKRLKAAARKKWLSS